MERTKQKKIQFQWAMEGVIFTLKQQVFQLNSEQNFQGKENQSRTERDSNGGFRRN